MPDKIPPGLEGRQRVGKLLEEMHIGDKNMEWRHEYELNPHVGPLRTVEVSAFVLRQIRRSFGQGDTTSALITLQTSLDRAPIIMIR